jgi:hypothetical protein
MTENEVNIEVMQNKKVSIPQNDSTLGTCLENHGSKTMMMKFAVGN